MRFEVTVTRDDYTKFCDYASYRANRTKSCKEKEGLRSFVLNVIVWCAIAFLLYTVLQNRDISLSALHWPTALIVTIPFIIFIALFIFYLKKYKENAIPKDNGLILGDWVVEIDQSGIKNTGALGGSVFKWELLDEVVLHEGNVYLFLDKMAAEIIPCSAFESESDAEKLKQYVETMRNNILRPTAGAAAE